MTYTPKWSFPAIREWQDKTFPNSTPRARLRKSVEEWLELDAALERGASPEEIAEEAADVAITACGWAHRDNIDACIPNMAYGVTLRGKPPSGDTSLDGMLVEFYRQDFEAILDVLGSIIGSYETLHRAIDAKMEKNVARDWTIREDGTGQHVEALETAEIVAELKTERYALHAKLEAVREEANFHQGRPEFTEGTIAARCILAILDGKEG